MCCASRTSRTSASQPDLYGITASLEGSLLPTEPRRKWRGFCFLRCFSLNQMTSLRTPAKQCSGAGKGPDCVVAEPVIGRALARTRRLPCTRASRFIAGNEGWKIQLKASDGRRRAVLPHVRRIGRREIGDGLRLPAPPGRPASNCLRRAQRPTATFKACGIGVTGCGTGATLERYSPRRSGHGLNASVNPTTVSAAPSRR
jgi:hypothetical protein